MKKTKQEKAMEKAIDQSFRAQSSGIQFNIMDLGKVLKMAEKLVVAGEPVDIAVNLAIVTYRLN